LGLIFRELGVFKKSLVLLIISVFVTSVSSMFLPMLMQHLIDYAIPNESYDVIFKVTGLMLIAVALLIISGIGTAKYAAEIATGVGHNVRKEVFDKVNGFSQQEVDTFSISSLITRTNTDVQNIQQFLALSLSIAVTAPIMCIVGVVMAISSSPELSKVLIIAIPVLVIIMALLGRMAIPLSDEIQKNIDSINMVIREKLTGTRVIRAFGTTKFEEQRFEGINNEYSKLNKKMMRIVGAFMPIITVVMALCVGGLFYFAGDLLWSWDIKITTGEVLAMTSYIIFIMTSVIMLSVVFLMLPRATTSARRIKEVLDSENLIQDPETPAEDGGMHGYLEFKNVSFTYAGADKPAVNNLSFKAGPGETTAIIGGTGMGKSTIINMIPRLYDATEGQVLVNGVDVRDYELDDLRGKIGFVPQRAALFKGTIDSNLAFGADNPTEDDIEEAAEIAQSMEFISRKKKGFQTSVAQGGSNFSGGQKQRLCIARALVRHCDVYVFDDSFSALDFKTDKQLRQALKSRTKNSTTVIVAQRVNTIMDADRIIVIDRGDIMGIGTHDELMKTCEVYQEIVHSQMKEEEE